MGWPLAASNMLAEARVRKRDSQLLDAIISRLSPMDLGEAIDGLRMSTMFSHLDEANLRRVATRMRRVEFEKGELMMHQGDPQLHMYVVVHGTVERLRYENGRLHETETLGTASSRNTIGALHLLYNQPTYATARCTTRVVAYRLSSEDLDELLESSQSISKQVIHALALEIKRQSSQQRTPLLEQQGLEFSVIPTSIAAGVESFYRSALNSYLNYRLTGQSAGLFPNMSVQLPTRVLYINGFKIARKLLDERVDPDDYEHPEAVGLLRACVPGVLMTPVSSVLEACNAGHANPEPLHTRWLRGLGPRMCREVIFGIGINQLSDWCEERVPATEPMYRAFFGSLSAGVACGYLSHVPHVLSTLKMLNPAKSYAQHAQDVVKGSYRRVPRLVPQQLRWGVAGALAMVAPVGLMVRTTQIAGSFVIINGLITVMQSPDRRPASAMLRGEPQR